MTLRHGSAPHGYLGNSSLPQPSGLPNRFSPLFARNRPGSAVTGLAKTVTLPCPAFFEARRPANREPSSSSGGGFADTQNWLRKAAQGGGRITGRDIPGGAPGR